MEQVLNVIVCFQSELTKGSKLLSDVTSLSESDNVMDVSDVADELRTRVDGFASQLDNVRDVIDDTAKCYEHLDKVSRDLHPA